MKKKITCVFMTMIMALSVLTVRAEDAEDALDLTGIWFTEEVDGGGMAMTIEDDSVTVYWVYDGEDFSGVFIYWVGTYLAPEEETEEYVWTSVRDAEKTDSEWLASTEDTKDFVYKDGVISIEAGALGYGGIVYFYPFESDELSDTDDAAAAEADMSVSSVYAEDPLSLTGNWLTEEADGMWMAMTIEDDTVSVYWVFDDEDFSGAFVYWVGTYLAPEEQTEEYVWTSVRDAGKTDFEWLASTEDTKDFIYKDGVISIEAGALGYSGIVYFYPFESDESADTADLAAESDISVGNGSGDFEGQTLVDNSECSVIITGIDEDGMWGYTLNVYLENKSEDVTYMFAVNDGAVNGLEDDPYFAREVSPGKKSNEEISFSAPDAYGIDKVTDIELDFSVYDSEDWSADNIVDETFHIYPFGEENASRYVREPQDSDIVLADTDAASMIITDFEPDGIWGYTVNVFLENNTNSKAMFTVDDASVNGYMIDPYWAKSVPAGTCAYASISWYESDFEDNSISEVSEIEMTIHIYDENDWSADDYVNETVTVNP